MSNEPNIEKWKSMLDLLEYLDMSREFALEAITKRDMPAHRIGRFWKFKFSEVDEWIRSGQAAGDPEDYTPDTKS
jgi:excisionase family DNA binding protein